jgi:hypothetical protein
MHDAKTIIKDLLNIDVQTNDAEALRLNPEAYVSSEQDASKLWDLFMLMDLTDEMEAENHDE